MEDSNEVSYSEIERVERLEHIIRNFRFAVAGGTIAGGFGALPENQSKLAIEQRLENITQSRKQFKLSGQGVDIAGNFEDGFTFT